MTAEAGLIASRFVHFAAVLLLFGAAAFPLYAFGDERGIHAEMLSARLRLALILAASAALASGVAWLCFAAANMSGTLANAINPSIIAVVVRETDFGKVWIWRIALAAVLVGLFWPKQQKEVLALVQTAGAALLLTSIGGTGHAGADATGWGTFHVAADSLHLLAASAWLGGLLPLAIVLASPAPDASAAIDVLERFSRMAVVAVAALVLSGIANGLLLVGSIGALTDTLYGRILLAKVAVFLAMLGFAVSNRSRLLPALAKEPANTDMVLRSLRTNIAAEQLLGLLVLIAVSVMGTLSPSGD